ncbi:IS110 family transposase [Actinomadura graeca]|uniref:IS110 family transposase n=1 Tax=Actinomadura graeca TaxID=2750812 RepID=A0ABX8R801_9ACTN|nr:IS110 family transposase [Actinomadura graeca]QXJ25887.1 IS110 family transposase [Actinomadura graeca]
MPSIQQPTATAQTETPAIGPEIVLGVDTHKDTHVAAAVTHLGVLLATAAFPATAAGYRDLLDWAHGMGSVRRAGVEGTGSYGAALTRYLHGQDVQVIDVNHPDRADRRRRGKTDRLDAEAAARAVISGRASSRAKTGDGQVEAMRLFKLAKDSATKARTQAINQLRAVLVTADPQLRESMNGLTSARLITSCAELTDGQAIGPAGQAAVCTLRLLAARVQHLTREIRDLQKRITSAIQAHTPALLDRLGIAGDTAATLLIAAGDNPDRMASEASYAALCGTSPVEASSGKSRRLRVNRGGDRQANAALYRIVVTRLRCDTRTRDDLDRRVREGKTKPEVMRCLKRYIAREGYQVIATDRPAASTAACRT